MTARPTGSSPWCDEESLIIDFFGQILAQANCPQTNKKNPNFNIPEANGWQRPWAPQASYLISILGVSGADSPPSFSSFMERVARHCCWTGKKHITRILGTTHTWGGKSRSHSPPSSHSHTDLFSSVPKKCSGAQLGTVPECSLSQLPATDHEIPSSCPVTPWKAQKKGLQ